MIKYFFVVASINVLYYIYRFAFVEPPLHPWDEANLIMVNDLSDVLLDLIYHYFIEDFCMNIHLEYWPTVILFGGVLVWFWDESNIGFMK
jgi:hypothetical protein